MVSNEDIDNMLDHIRKQSMIIKNLKRRLNYAEKILSKIADYIYLDEGLYLAEVESMIKSAYEYFNPNKRKRKNRNGKKS